MVARATGVIQTGKQQALTLCCLISVCYEVKYIGFIPLVISMVAVICRCIDVVIATTLPSIATTSTMLVPRSITGSTTELTLYFKEYKIVKMFHICDIHYHVLNFIPIMVQMWNRCHVLLSNGFINAVGNNCGKTLLILGLKPHVLVEHYSFKKEPEAGMKLSLSSINPT